MPKAMIISVGGTPAPIVKSIREYKPEFISFLASQDTCDLVASIKKEVVSHGLNIKSETTLADDINDLVHCHEKAEEAVERVITKGYRKEDIIVDYTGGTKNMSVSLALASISYGFSFSYVGGKERTKNGVGIVVNGQEEIYPSVNPWDFLAIEERKKIAILFNTYQFKAAKNLTDTLLEKTTKFKSLFKKIGFLIEGYYEWDLFRHQKALDLFKRAKIEEILETEDKSIKAFAKAAETNRLSLKAIVKNEKKPSGLLILDLYANAERRFNEGKVDDAVLRLYRLVEMIAQERLFRKYGIDVSDVKEEKIPEGLKGEFIKNYKSQSDGKIKISQTATFKLLNALHDELGNTFKLNEKRFLDIQSSRNYSYLAHGFESSKEKTYLTLRDFILELNMFEVKDAPVFPKMEI
ncbi:MAG: CRISPR-associated protein [Candidatus Schekmanbacteria bacterium RBG_16_38_10]|uniref:CRISPR-associated protein n=1 Tax=Candidatus Schekmanbacteria bacterium RBG_16_38_10 TaxID=1817879 RepID=A0A1F7RRX5_9BACT|nr:MAG: CRISPR-associated protein [Candidatus Schekmanbacteria bacterium RBG_16_38_10]